MAYSGLETLFQNMGPTYAASIAGEREGTAQGLDILEARKRQEELLALQQAYKQAEVMNPLKAQYEQGKINEQGALLPGQQADSRLRGIAADQAAATSQSTINKVNSANDLAIMGDKLKSLENMRDRATQYVAQIMSAGPGAEAAKNQLVASGQLPPQISQMLSQIPAANLPALLEKANSYVNQQGAAYQQAISTAKIQKESHIAGASIAANAMLKGKQMEIDAGKFKNKTKGVQDIETAVQSGKMSPAQATVAFQGAAMFEDDPEVKQKLLSMAAQYEKLSMNLANAKAGTSPDLSQMGVPVNKVPATMGQEPSTQKRKSLSDY